MIAPTAEQRIGGKLSAFGFFNRPGRDGAAKPHVVAPRAGSDAAAITDAEQAVLTQADALASQVAWLRAMAPEGCIGGVQIIGGEAHAWAVDRVQPLRPVALAMIIDGSVVMEAFTNPTDGTLRMASGWSLAEYGSVEVLINGVAFQGAAYIEQRFWATPAARAEAHEFLDRMQRGWRAHRARRQVQHDIGGTLDRFAGIETAQDGLPVPFLRYFADSTKTPIKGAGALGLANWVIADVMEDPLRREIFCLDPATEATLNQPAFSTAVQRDDISLALLCFWRRHYQSLDLLADAPLRRLQFKFVSAPFIRLKNNDRLVTAAMRERLRAPAPVRGGQVLPWSWYWVCLHQDQNQAERLDDAHHLMALSFREAAADALDPPRLSFNPPSWQAWWSGWACGEDIGFSRFDLALISLLEPRQPPAALVAEQGGAHWRARLHDAFFAQAPGLASLSLAATASAPAHDVDVDVDVDEDSEVVDLAIIGYTNGTGLARNMAMFVEALAPYHPVVFDARTGKCMNDQAADVSATRARVVLLCVNAGHSPEVIGRFAALCAYAHVIGFYLWETDTPPALHAFGARAVDEIWAPSEFVAAAYRKITDVPVVMVGKGLRPPPAPVWQRAARRFRADGAFTFLCVADFASSIVRKHPLAVVSAFRAAFDADNTNVRLIIKLREIDRAHWSNLDGYWEQLEALVGADRRISLLTGDLSNDEYWGLLGACDALVTLHRGEGFCYPAADAMMLGRLVIATDYSGTSDYCTRQTAMLVEADVVVTPPGHMRCTTPIGHWAEPRHDSAVLALRQAVTRRADAAALAQAGARLMAERYGFNAWRTTLIGRISPHIDGTGAPPGQLMLTSLAPAWPSSSGQPN